MDPVELLKFANAAARGFPALVVAVLASVVVLFLFFLWFIRQPRPVKIPFKNRRVLITGGSSGIGLELAKLAAAEGASVTILARDVRRLAEAQRSIAGSTGLQVQVLSADVKDFESVKVALQEAGPVDILVCSHGISIPAALESASLDDINEMLDVNLKGNIHVIKAALPLLKRSGMENDAPASIAIFSSLAGQAGLYGFTAYAASKFGIRGLAEALQQELLPYNIRISVIFPPDTYTPGYFKENECKPEITKILSSSSGAMEAVDVARKSLNGIKAGHFLVSCHFDGFMLSTVSAGMAPQPSLPHALAEVFLPGVLRLVALCVVWGWYKKVAKWHNHQKKSEQQNIKFRKDK